MQRVSKLIVPNAVVVLVVMSGIAIGVGTGQARAEDCLAAPNVSSPPGQHWYYRIDRVNRRKCWYLHAPLRVAHRAHSASIVANAAIEHSAAAVPMPAAAPIAAAAVPMPAAAVPMPVADPPMAASAPATSDTPSLPHVTVLAVKTIPVQPSGVPTQTQSRDGAGGASISQASTRAYTAAPQSKSDPTMFFFLVFGLGITAFLTAIVVRRAAPWASWFWPVRSEAGRAWPQQRGDYSSAGPMRLKSRPWSGH